MLVDFSVVDWQLAGLVCQLLWNYSKDIRASNLTFGEEEAQQLITILTDYIGNSTSETTSLSVFLPKVSQTLRTYGAKSESDNSVSCYAASRIAAWKTCEHNDI